MCIHNLFKRTGIGATVTTATATAVKGGSLAEKVLSETDVAPQAWMQARASMRISRGYRYSLLSVFTALFLLAATSGFAEDFVPHKQVPGYPRFPTEAADSSGKVNADPMFMADRLAIINLVHAYSYLIDEGRWDEWYNLFSDDVVFEATVPMLGMVRAKNKEALRASNEIRYVEPGKYSTAVRRHTMGNIEVTEQTKDHAKVRTYMFISAVPRGDKLNMLTSGTYNATLEKRNDRWVITRWYIETDAFVAPSEAPDRADFDVEVSPLTIFPGWKGPAKALPGKISINKSDAAMPATGPLYVVPKVASWDDTDVAIVDYVTDARKAAALLPEGVTTFPIKDLPGFAAVKLTWANYRQSTYGPYHEFIVSIPCLWKGELYLYVPYIYVTTDAAMAAGRETGGWPKKIADIDLKRVGDSLALTFDRGDAEVTAKMEIAGKILSTPLPKDKPPFLGYPYNMTLVLPKPTGKPQETVPLPTMSLRVIPGVGANYAKPALAQLIGADWKFAGDFFGSSGTTVNIRGSKEDPLEALPVYNVVGGMFLHGKMTLDVADMKLLNDYLK